MEENYENVINNAIYEDAPHISNYFDPGISLVLQPLTESDYEEVGIEMPKELQNAAFEQNNSPKTDLTQNSKDSDIIEPPVKRVAVSFDICKITKSERNYPFFWFRNLETGDVVTMKVNHFTKKNIVLKCRKSECDATIKNMGYNRSILRVHTNCPLNFHKCFFDLEMTDECLKLLSF